MKREGGEGKGHGQDRKDPRQKRGTDRGFRRGGGGDSRGKTGKLQIKRQGGSEERGRRGKGARTGREGRREPEPSQIQGKTRCQT